jgi:hypothetical protein
MPWSLASIRNVAAGRPSLYFCSAADIADTSKSNAIAASLIHVLFLIVCWGVDSSIYNREKRRTSYAKATASQECAKGRLGLLIRFGTTEGKENTEGLDGSW